MPLAADVQQLLRSCRHLTTARALADRRIAEARTRLIEHQHPGLDIVGFGSLARREVTAESDFDYLVLAKEMPRGPDVALKLLKIADDLRRQWATEEGIDADGKSEVRGPGASGIFARAVGAFDLVHQIGLQEDTNHSLTRRMLLLEESVSLLDPEVRSEVVLSTLRRYLELGESDANKVPRFLLNDVTRYWHTITVDYQAKARVGPDDSGLRYLKLIISRKILFAGTVMTLLLCGKPGWHQATADELLEQFELTPLERLIQGYDGAPGQVRDAMAGVLDVADHFLEKSGDKDWRHVVKGATKSSGCGEFDQMREQADVLQGHLEQIFFGWELIRDQSLRTLVF